MVDTDRILAKVSSWMRLWYITRVGNEMAKIINGGYRQWDGMFHVHLKWRLAKNIFLVFFTKLAVATRDGHQMSGGWSVCKDDRVAKMGNQQVARHEYSCLAGNAWGSEEGETQMAIGLRGYCKILSFASCCYVIISVSQNCQTCFKKQNELVSELVATSNFSFQ